MVQINFYALTDTAHESEAAKLELVCRIVEKATSLGHRIYIRTESEAQSRLLDKLLWEFKSTSFLPHEISSEPANNKICISHEQPPEQFDDALINLHQEPVAEPRRLARLNELVGPDQKSLQAGREHFRAYKALGLDIETHKL